MKARSLVLLILALASCVGWAEPRARPRLAPQAAEEQKPESNDEFPLQRGPEFTPRYRSFQSYLQAEARKSVGLGKTRPAAGNDVLAPVETSTSSGKGATDAPGADLLILPTVEVTAKKIPVEAIRLADLESQLRSGDKASVETWLDSFLNPAFLLGESAKVRAARARRRGEVLGWQKVMLLSLDLENSPAEKARIEADIQLLNTILRSWK